jgi:hypothetical protein
LEKKTGTEQ